MSDIQHNGMLSVVMLIVVMLRVVAPSGWADRSRHEIKQRQSSNGDSLL
jgi:hypothetical protein